ncbi:mucin-related [Striga asiatica]|uniref:Mucin-related n=1 Tax=Striga asiatica TaxID=4170 RepID=A0A5A7PF57_STRAF|nr:mucin-related [Striga asiatica]
MRILLRAFSELSIKTNPKSIKLHNMSHFPVIQRAFSTQDEGRKNESDWAAHFGGTGSSGPESLGWDVGPSSWSTGLTKEHFDGEVVGQQVRSDAGHSKPSVGGMGGPKEGGLYSEVRWTDEEIKKMNELETANRKGKAFVDSWDDRMDETTVLMKQVHLFTTTIIIIAGMF